MPTSAHRGPHPHDPRDLGPAAWEALQRATADLSWLLERGYAYKAATKLVGDKFQLTLRQRDAILRSSCPSDSRARRQSNLETDLTGKHLDIDGFNVLIPIERAIGGGPLLRGVDGALRDIGSVHGTWRVVRDTTSGIDAVGRATAAASSVTWWLDQPVSNSGRLAGLIRAHAEQHGWPWTVNVVNKVDPALAESEHVVATSDAWILDQGVRWYDLIGHVLLAEIPEAWVVPMKAPACKEAQ